MLKTIPSIVSEIRANISTISSSDAFEECKAKSGIIVDVREPGEVQQSAVEASINIPRGLLEMKMLELYPDADLPIYIHCATGARASFAGEQLQRVGYNNVKVITCDLNTIQKVK
jgi:rhodanese-related sulfurtransferase